MSSISQSALDLRQRTWEDRISRARDLQDCTPATAPVLSFYEKVLEFQRDLSAASKSTLTAGLPLREQIDLVFAVSKMPAILSLAINSGPEALAIQAKSLKADDKAQWRRLLTSALSSAEPKSPAAFFARACLQPLAHNLQSQLPTDPNYSQSTCPACGGLPQAAVLRPEGDGGRRWLLCSFCLGEWVFRRVLCPWCGEGDKERLPRYSADECSYVRVEGCDTCKRYLKAVDLTIDGRAIPLIDEVALAVLDVWALEHGYTKITHNLMGL